MAAILDSLVGSCAIKLQEIITEEAVLILGVKEELKELQRKMTQIQCVLNDAEERSTKESAVNNWLGELRDAMYYADDIIDMARSEGGKLLADRPSSSRESIKCGGISFFTCIPNVLKRHKIAVQIRNFNAELEKISKMSEFLKLQNLQPKAEVSTVKKSINLVEPNLVGKETLHACKRLVGLVLANKEKKAYKVGIVGTGGIGKTTLAQKIYNDQKIKGLFSNQAWICVSQKYSEVAILKEVLRNFGVHQEQGETVGELSSKLAAAVTDKSFFLVLDDVWQPEVWTNLLRIPLHAAATGVILVTTRHDTVAHAIGMENLHRVDLMSADVGWEMLWKSMNVNEEKDVEKLQDMGYDIVCKCGGLPLAIKVTASVLATKEKTENEWRKFIDRSAWSVGNLPTELRGALYLSYDDLPSHLKQCFLYLALYPEDWYIERNDLIRLWVAEGFIEEQQGQLLEEIAEEYCYELIYRNLLQPDPSRADHSRFKMHDLLRQLAQHISREESFCGDPQSLGAKTLSKLRRVSIVTEKDFIVFPNMDKEMIRVRTLLLTFAKRPNVGNTIFKILPCIRVLDLTGSSIQTIPDCIGSLIHLRLLDLGGTLISCLPESIVSLINLQILNLERCKALHSLPLAIIQLCNLRRLGLYNTPINQVPKGIGRLEFLNDLEGFPLGGGGDNDKTQDGWKLEELEHLSHLRQLHMIKLERATPYNTDSLLTEKKHLKVLNLFCTERTDEPYSEEDVSKIEKIFEQLIPPQNLENLYISRFFGRRYPTWLGTTHLASVMHLQLLDCNSCVHLPPLGQLPNLKYLKIDGAAAVTKIGPEFVGCGEDNRRSTDAVVAFPKLETLVFWDMLNWEEWSFVEEGDEEAAEGGEDGSAEIQKGEAQSPGMHLLPRLKVLELRGCPKLGSLPRQLGQEATSLELLGFRESSLKVVEDFPFLSELLVIDGCGGLERVSNLPQVGRLRVNCCPGLRRVEGLGSLQQLWLGEDMKDLSSLWIPGLQQEHKQLHGEDMDVYVW
ncbi:putative disease resistance protein RGA4 [Lolium rigidum]|uniref:putative disease resistance protein RGA4 n=1 Tax=Lolium rigidum TaxID=89674 RepID=UPI001F5DCBF5|nr:putative disease resistance protein RGA4 [Lolium rigidum]XP_047091287.1 putative disease resistance protein RGA4 [Lolium rigidum]